MNAPGSRDAKTEGTQQTMLEPLERKWNSSADPQMQIQIPIADADARR